MDYREEYKKFAEENGYNYTDERSDVLFLGCDNGNKVRTEFCHLQKGDFSFFAYDMFSPKAFMNNTYCGVYRLLGCDDEGIECEILRKGESVLNFIIYSSGDKTGDDFIDKNLYIRSKDLSKVSKYITRDFAQSYIDLWDSSGLLPVKVVLGRGSDVLPSVPMYAESNVIGLSVNGKWVSPSSLGKFIANFSKHLNLIHNS